MVPTFEYGDEILESVSNTFFQVLFIILHNNSLAGYFEVIRSTRGGACGTFKGGALSRGPFL